MATETVGHLLDIIVGHLQDQDNDQWTLTELVDFYNEAIRETVTLNPDSNAETESIKLASGSEHYIPAQGVKLLDIISNMGTDGETPGEAITSVQLMAVEAFNRNWRTETADSTIINFIPDPNNPKKFYTCPPSDGTAYVLMKYAKLPDTVVYDPEDDSWEDIPIGVNDDFVEAIHDKIMEYCYKKDTDIPGNKQREDDAGNEFLTEMAARAQ